MIADDLQKTSLTNAGAEVIKLIKLFSSYDNVYHRNG